MEKRPSSEYQGLTDFKETFKPNGSFLKSPQGGNAPCIICITCLTLLRELFILKTQSQLTRFIQKIIGSNNLEKYPHMLFDFITIKISMQQLQLIQPNLQVSTQRLNTHQTQIWSKKSKRRSNQFKTHFHYLYFFFFLYTCFGLVLNP